ncbi:hypothetical protein AB4254_08040 [Vibrio breoganii]
MQVNILNPHPTKSYSQVVREYKNTILTEAKDIIERTYRHRRFTHMGNSIRHSPYPSYLTEKQKGHWSVVTSKGGYVSLMLNDECKTQYLATNHNKETLTRQLTQVLLDETALRVEATQRHYNSLLNISLI